MIVGLKFYFPLKKFPKLKKRERNFRFEQVDDSVRLPYIGGHKGQVLEIRQRPDGTIFSRILMDEPKHDIKRRFDFDPLTIQNTRALGEFADLKQENNFESSLASIQEAAQELVTIQEIYKEAGRLTNEQRRIYQQSLEKLGVSAQKLANVQGTDDDLKLLLERTEPVGEKMKQGSKKKPNEEKNPPRFPPYNQKRIDQLKKDEECEESKPVGEEGSELTSTSAPASTTPKSTTTKKPPMAVVVSSGNTATANDAQESTGDEESSVAEAKPTGLAIAGVGGVASSKPVGTAVVGPGGLAVARPVGTAIAGIKPSEYGQLGLQLPAKIKNVQYRGSAATLPYRGKYGIVSYGSEDDEEGPTRLLVGPEYLAEARLADKGIDSNDEDISDKVEDNAQEPESYMRPIVAEEEEKNNFEEHQISQSPYGVSNFGKLPLFPVSYDRFNYPNPYFLPPNSYVPIPIVNQYLQRRSFNNALRYPQIISPFPQYYGNYYNPSTNYAPVRYFYDQ